MGGGGGRARGQWLRLYIHINLSRDLEWLSWMRRISYLVEFWKRAWIRQWSHYLVSWLKRGLTFSVQFAPGLNLGGLGNNLWMSIPTVSSSPIFHATPFVISSLAWRRLCQTKDGWLPNLASINEQVGKYRAL